jgi:hypothetical protein
MWREPKRSVTALLRGTANVSDEGMVAPKYVGILTVIGASLSRNKGEQSGSGSEAFAVGMPTKTANALPLTADGTNELTDRKENLS